MFFRAMLYQSLIVISSSLLLNTVSFAEKNKNCLPFLPGLPDQALMISPTKTYLLPATPQTSRWGVFDNKQSPVLTIHSGDSVVIETLAAQDNQVVPGTHAANITEMNFAVEGRGPHTVTGPIYVEGAEPGDTLRIHFNKIVPRPYASNNTVPGKGLFPQEFPDSRVKYFYLDRTKMQMEFAPGIMIPLAPFPGVIAVARKEPGPYSSGPPGQFGGNMDLREMTEGTTVYLPVFVKGGLVWTGDSHAGQGNGEIDLTAIETAFAEFNITIDVIKQKSLAWPRVETKTHWIAVGYDKDLNKALDILKEETIKLIMEQRNVSRSAAEKIMLATWDCPISEVVNGVQGVYCKVPKQHHATKFLLSKKDSKEFFATYGKDNDVEVAMKVASMAMINKVAQAKNMERNDVYMLASFAMDCRIAPYQSGEKEVYCMMPKTLWVS